MTKQFGITSARRGCSDLSPMRWGTTDAKSKGLPAQGYQRFPLSKPVVGLNIASHAVPAYRASTYLVSVFPAHSTSFSPIVNSGMCIMNQNFYLWEYILFFPDMTLTGRLNIKYLQPNPFRKQCALQFTREKEFKNHIVHPTLAHWRGRSSVVSGHHTWAALGECGTGRSGLGPLACLAHLFSTWTKLLPVSCVQTPSPIHPCRLLYYTSLNFC